MNQALFQVQGVDAEERPDVCPCGHNLPNEGIRQWTNKLESEFIMENWPLFQAL